MLYQHLQVQLLNCWDIVAITVIDVGARVVSIIMMLNYLVCKGVRVLRLKGPINTKQSDNNGRGQHTSYEFVVVHCDIM